MNEIVMPRLSDSMEEGTILRWLVADGTEVSRGVELAEIETDKAAMVYEADAAGTLRIVAREGETLPVGAPIAQLLDPGEDAPSNGSATPAAEIAEDAPPDGNGTPAAELAEERTPVDREQLPGAQSSAADARPAAAAAPSPVGAPTATDAQTPHPGADPDEAPSARAPGARVKASPLARRLAAEASIDVASLAGSGPGGRVVKADVQRAAALGAAPASSAAADMAANGAATAPATGMPPATGTKGEGEIVELTRTQELIARRMAEAKATIPEFTLQCEIDMSAAVALRSELKALAERRQQPAPSFNDLVVKACGLALREHPRANGTYRDGRFELHGRVNVAVAVAVTDALVVPVVRDADRLSVWEISAETRRLAAAVRDGTIRPPELSGGTFSVSNLGMFGVDAFTAVINPPQAAILAVGSLAQRAVVRDGELRAAHTMTVTLSCDHRILYGADAAQFLAKIRELLQQPLALLA